jgi:hypothetical protein
VCPGKIKWGFAISMPKPLKIKSIPAKIPRYGCLMGRQKSGNFSFKANQHVCI